MLLGITLGASSLRTLKASEGPSPYNQVQNGLSKTDVREIVDTVDRLYDANKMEEGLTFLEKYSDSNEAEILWRLARLAYKVLNYSCSQLM